MKALVLGLSLIVAVSIVTVKLVDHPKTGERDARQPQETSQRGQLYDVPPDSTYGGSGDLG